MFSLFFAASNQVDGYEETQAVRVAYTDVMTAGRAVGIPKGLLQLTLMIAWDVTTFAACADVMERFYCFQCTWRESGRKYVLIAGYIPVRE